MGSVIAGVSLSVFGCAGIALYTWMNGRARTRGARAHFLTGWLIGGPGMLAIGSGWSVLAFAEPRVEVRGLTAAGVVSLLAGLLLYGASARTVGRWKSLANYKPGLQTGGLNARLRHPQALALCLLAIGGALVNGSIPSLLTLPLWVGFWVSYTHLEEENELIPTFGDEYREYIRNTPRMVPWKGERGSARSEATREAS